MTLLNPMIDHEPDFEDLDDFEDFYNEDGDSSESGLFDAGGHLITERWADYADDLHDRMKYKE